MQKGTFVNAFWSIYSITKSTNKRQLNEKIVLRLYAFWTEIGGHDKVGYVHL